MGELCFSNERCRSNQCHLKATDGLPSGYCTESCDAEKGCRSGYFCKNSECLKQPDLRYGNRCAADEECISNLCIGFSPKPIPSYLEELYPLAATTTYLCTQPCESSCDECMETQDGNAVCIPTEDLAFYLVRYKAAHRALYPLKFKEFGKECRFDDECRSGLCAFADGIGFMGTTSGFCTTSCEEDNDCDASLSCKAMRCVLREDLQH